MPDHSIFTCVRELARLKTEGKLITVEAFGHAVDILEHLRQFMEGKAPLALAADEEAALESAVEELKSCLGMTEKLQHIRTGSTDEVSLPVRGVLLTVILQMFADWMSNPEVQQRLLEWLFGVFKGGEEQ